jgi:hypothetical protein
MCSLRLPFLPHSDCGPSHKPTLWSAVTKFRCRWRYYVAWGWFDYKPEIAARTSKALDLLWGLAIKPRRGGDLFQDELSETLSPVKLPLRQSKIERASTCPTRPIASVSLLKTTY